MRSRTRGVARAFEIQLVGLSNHRIFDSTRTKLKHENFTDVECSRACSRHFARKDRWTRDRVIDEQIKKTAKRVSVQTRAYLCLFSEPKRLMYRVSFRPIQACRTLLNLSSLRRPAFRSTGQGRRDSCGRIDTSDLNKLDRFY